MKATIITGLAALLCTYFEIFEEESLDSTGASLIEMIQNLSTPEFNTISKWFDTGLTLIFAYFAGMIYLCWNRKLGIKSVLAEFISTCHGALLKMCICHPRPMWKYSKINGVKQKGDFGAPSMQTFSNGSLMFYLGSLWLETGQTVISKAFVIIFAMLITVFNNTYLGEEFYFPAILGYSYAAFLASIMMRPGVDNYINSVVKKLKNIYIIHIFSVTFIGIGIFLINFRQPEWNNNWSINYKNKTGEDLSLHSALLQNLLEMSYVFAIAGFIIGYRCLKGKYRLINFNYKNAILSFAYLSLLFGFMYGIELAIGLLKWGCGKLFFFCIEKYVSGFTLGYIIPVLISKNNSGIIDITEDKSQNLLTSKSS